MHWQRQHDLSSVSCVHFVGEEHLTQEVEEVAETAVCLHHVSPRSTRLLRMPTKMKKSAQSQRCRLVTLHANIPNFRISFFSSLEVAELPTKKSAIISPSQSVNTHVDLLRALATKPPLDSIVTNYRVVNEDATRAKKQKDADTLSIRETQSLSITSPRFKIR